MQLGILICDHVNPKLKSEHGDYKKMFADLLKLTAPHVKTRFYFVIDGVLPNDINECDAYMTSGSKYSVNDEFDWITKLENFVKQLHLARKKLIGVCFGHQLIAKALGGEVKVADKGWGIGVSRANIVKQQEWMTPFKPELNLLVSHQEQVTVLPEQGQVLLSSDFCPYSMFQIDKHFLGLQGHPEFSKPYVLALMRLREPSIGVKCINQGRESMTRALDAERLMLWIMKFLEKN